MNSQINYIVGDKFKQMTSIEGICTYSEAMEHAKSKNDADRLYFIGQGLHDDKINVLRENNLPILNGDMKPAPRILVHKRKKENILITDPIRVSPNTFTSSLIVDDSCAEMMDHVTGTHISGNLLIEATRQFSVACMEVFVFDEIERGHHRFVWDKFEISFKKFIFPLEIDIFLTFLKESPWRLCHT